ncbi:hypothetical protein K8R43_03940 [archaeon]|nr:hypothetical protein [archaeon]
MVLGKRAQFFLIILVFMIIIIVGLAYYAIESRNLPAETSATPERGTPLLSQIKSEILNALERKPYTGKNISEYYTTFHREANRTNFDLSINCNETNTTTGANNYPKYDIECILDLSWKNANLTTSFTHSYTVPYEIITYLDSDYTTESDYFNLNDTIYYRITGRNNDKINFTATRQNTQKNTQNHTLSDHYSDGSFTVDAGGAWILKADNYNTSEISYKTIYVQEIEIKITIEGTCPGWCPRNSYIRGENFRYNIETINVKGHPVSVPIMITVQRPDGTPPVGEYDLETLTNTSGIFISENQTIHSSEVVTNLTIKVTELDYYSYNTTTIQILAQNYDRFIEVPAEDMNYTALSNETFSSTCGYDTWFTNSTQNYYNGSLDIPFYREKTDETTIRLNQTTKTIDLPQVHAKVLHIIGARHNISEE